MVKCDFVLASQMLVTVLSYKLAKEQTLRAKVAFFGDAIGRDCRVSVDNPRERMQIRVSLNASLVSRPLPLCGKPDKD